MSIRELFYDPLGAYDEGRWIRSIGGHADHVHVSFGDVPTALKGIQVAQRMGLRVSENPYVDKVDPVHVDTSYHYRTLGVYRGKPVGAAIDVSGPPEKMAAFFNEVKRWTGDAAGAPSVAPGKGTQAATGGPVGSAAGVGCLVVLAVQLTVAAAGVAALAKVVI